MLHVAQALTLARVQIPAAEARLLLGEAMQQSPAWLLTHDDAAVPEAVANRFNEWVTRRAAGEPVAYLIGKREFYGRDFFVAPGVLIPRPETELLVEIACAKVSAGGTANEVGSVLDLGTGSGCIALSIACACPQAQVTALDVSREALAIAERNRVALQASVRLMHSDWFSAVAGERFDLIVSNPPYIRAADAHLHHGDLRYEPPAALASGADGLDALRHLIGQAPAYLRPGGELWLEHGYDQAVEVRTLLRSAGFEDVASRRDLADIERISGGRWPA